jgi:hypothetical protein
VDPATLKGSPPPQGPATSGRVTRQSAGSASSATGFSLSARLTTPVRMKPGEELVFNEMERRLNLSWQGWYLDKDDVVTAMARCATAPAPGPAVSCPVGADNPVTAADLVSCVRGERG